MSTGFDQVKGFILELGYRIYQEVPAEEIAIISDTERGIYKLIIDCEESVVVLEQLIMKLPASAPTQVYKRLLQMNRDLVCGSFVLDEKGETLLFRDTLALENLDRNELESSINALSLGLAEFGDELLSFAKK